MTGFEGLLAGMKTRDFSVVVCWHVDRLYRSLKDLERLIDIADQTGCKFATVNSGDFNFATSSGRMIARILGSVARQESEHHGERRREANADRAKAGEWYTNGPRCYGYDRTGQPLEPEATRLREAARGVLSGHSLHSIARRWNAEGHTTTRGAEWTNLHLRRVLMNPRVAGLRVHRGDIVGPGSWEPVIDPETWRGLCAYLREPSRRSGVAWERRYMLSGIARCGLCGAKLYATYPHGRDRGMVYACRPTAHVARSGQALDDFVAVAVLEWLSRPDAGLRLGVGGADMGELQTQRAALVARKDELGTLFGRGVIDAAQLENGSVELRAQIAGIDRQLADATRVSPAATLAADKDRLWERWEQLSSAMRAQIIDEVAVITVHPAGRSGRRDFDPAALVDIEFKSDPKPDA